MDYEVQRCTRRCAATQRELAEGELFYSVLVAEGAQVLRYDYSAEAWQGPPQGNVLGWWKSHMPTREAKRAHLAPNDVLLEYFQELIERGDQPDVAYVLALLLVRRRVLRLDETALEAGGEVLVLTCPREDATYRVPALTPSDERTDEIQQQLAQLLYADAR